MFFITAFGIGTLFLFYRDKHKYVVKHEMYILNWFNMYFNGFKDLRIYLCTACLMCLDSLFHVVLNLKKAIKSNLLVFMNELFSKWTSLGLWFVGKFRRQCSGMSLHLLAHECGYNIIICKQLLQYHTGHTYWMFS